MAIPSSGQLALSTIRDEFGPGTTSNVNLRTLSAAAGLSVPDGFNEFYGLSAYTPPSYLSGANSISGAGTASNPYTISPTMSAAYWAGDAYEYYSYTYGRYVTFEFSNCSQPDEQFKAFSIQTASSIYNFNYVKFTNQFSGTQKMYVKFVSSNINFNSSGYTGFFWNSSEASFNVNYQNPSGNVWTSTVVNKTDSGSNFTRSVGSQISLFGGFTQWSLEGNGFGSSACDNPYDESQWQIYLDVPSANYKLSMSNFVIQVWFTPI